MKDLREELQKVLQLHWNDAAKMSGGEYLFYDSLDSKEAEDRLIEYIYDNFERKK